MSFLNGSNLRERDLICVFNSTLCLLFFISVVTAAIIQREALKICLPQNHKKMSGSESKEVIHLGDDSDVEFIGSSENVDNDCVLIKESGRPKKKRKIKSLETEPNLECSSSPLSTIHCCVCLENYGEKIDKFSSTLCGHIYCQRCLEEIMKQIGQKACAICRKKLTKKSYHRIFLN